MSRRLRQSYEKTAGACRSKRGRGVRHVRVSVERTHGLQAAGRGAVELPVRASAGPQHGVTRRVGEAGAAEAALRLPTAARAVEPARPGGEREACLSAV